MKRVILILMLFLSFGGTLFAQEVYSRPFSEDHKVWLYQLLWDATNYYNEYFTEGDTLINGRKCFKVYLCNESGFVGYECSIFDEGKKTYVIDREQTVPRLLYDFDITVGDNLTVLNGTDNVRICVDEEAQLECNDRLFRELSLHNIDHPDDPSNEDYYTTPSAGYWIEGIGGSGRYFQYSAWWDDFNHLYFSACFVDGELVYSNQFYVPIVDGIETNNIENRTNNAVFDIDGRKIKNDLDGLPKGVYIQNGKKIVVN